MTTITVVGTPLTVETSTRYSRLLDANDVLVNSTNLEMTSTGIKDKANAAVFASAVAAGQLLPGNHVQIIGLGEQSGTLTFNGLPANNETVTIGNLTYEYVTAAGTTTTPDSVEVLIGATAADAATNLEQAIAAQYAQKNTDIHATVVTAPTPVVTVYNSDFEVTASITGTLTNVTIVNFGSANTGAQGVFKIVSATDTLITLSPSPTADANANNLRVVVKGSHIRPHSDLAKITPHSFQLEREFSDKSLYEVYKGQRMKSWMLTMNTGELLQNEISFEGTEISTHTTKQLSDPVAHQQIEVLGSPVLNASSDVVAVKQDGTPFPTIITSAELEVSTDLRPNYVLSKKFAAGIGEGRLIVKISLEAYFLNHNQFNDFIADQDRSFEFEVRDLDGNRYVVHIPRGRISTWSADTGGIDNDIVQEFEVSGLYDPVSKTELAISRFSSDRAHVA